MTVLLGSDMAWESLSKQHKRGRRGHCGYPSANSQTLITLPRRLILNVRPRCCVELRGSGTMYFSGFLTTPVHSACDPPWGWAGSEEKRGFFNSRCPCHANMTNEQHLHVSTAELLHQEQDHTGSNGISRGTTRLCGAETWPRMPASKPQTYTCNLVKGPRKIAFAMGTVVMLAAEPALGQLEGQGGCWEALHSPGKGGRNQGAAPAQGKD